MHPSDGFCSLPVSSFSTSCLKSSFGISRALCNEVAQSKCCPSRRAIFASSSPFVQPTSFDAAAVRGDARSDLATAGTDGIDRRGPAQAAESVHKGLGKEERCCKSGGIACNFGGSGVNLRPLGTLRMTICFAMSRAGEMRILLSPRLKSKRRFRFNVRVEGFSPLGRAALATRTLHAQPVLSCHRGDAFAGARCLHFGGEGRS